MVVGSFLGYGASGPAADRLWEPEAATRPGGAFAPAVRLGSRWEVGRQFTLNLEGERYEDAGPAEYHVSLTAELYF